MIRLICHQNSIRLRYVVDYLAQRLGVSIKIQLGKNVSNTADEIVINYTNHLNNGDFSIYNEGLLFENHIRETDEFPRLRHAEKTVELFPSDYDRYNINFDLFSAIFFSLSRYEEYLPFAADKHGRFTAEQSHAFKNEYLRVPVVDVWVTDLIARLNKEYNLKLTQSNSYCIQPTIDIDSAWAYKHRSLFHTIGSLVKNLFSLNAKALRGKWKSRKEAKDPYDTFEYLKESLSPFDSIYFILMNFERPFDTAHYIDETAFKTLVNKIASYAEIGIHPSYASQNDSKAVDNETVKLERIIEKHVTKSRQHFLKLKFPDTYESLISNNVMEDYSMGYAGQIGFRAGTSLPFKFYHLKDEQSTDLLIHPFCMMDVTLRQYYKLTVKEAIAEVIKMKTVVRETHGCFNFIWHNSSFAKFEGWSGWDKVFEELIKV